MTSGPKPTSPLDTAATPYRRGAVVAAVEKKPGSVIDEAAVLALFEGRLARFKHPRRVVFVDALPKSAIGKVQKVELRALLEGA